MQKYVKNYFEKFSIPSSSANIILNAFNMVGENPFKELRSLYSKDYPLNIDQMEAVLKRVVEQTGLEKRVVNLLGVLSLLELLEERLKKRGVSQLIIDKTVIDLVYKMNECKRVYGYEGLMQFSWFKAILEERCFGIGRLQFEIDGYRLDEYTDGKNTIKKAQPSLSVHIPGSGEEFSDKACKQAYNSAVTFFKEFFPDVFKGAIAFTSWTWLLWPNNNLILREDSNVLRFQKDFDIIEQDLYKTNDSIAWRIFDVEKIEDIDSLPENTYLQRKAKEYIKNGNLLGWGFGVFFKQ